MRNKCFNSHYLYGFLIIIIFIIFLFMMRTAINSGISKSDYILALMGLVFSIVGIIVFIPLTLFTIPRNYVVYDNQMIINYTFTKTSIFYEEIQSVREERGRSIVVFIDIIKNNKQKTIIINSISKRYSKNLREVLNNFSSNEDMIDDIIL